MAMSAFLFAASCPSPVHLDRKSRSMSSDEIPYSCDSAPRDALADLLVAPQLHRPAGDEVDHLILG